MQVCTYLLLQSDFFFCRCCAAHAPRGFQVVEVIKVAYVPVYGLSTESKSAADRKSLSLENTKVRVF